METGLLVMFRFWVFVAGWVNQRQNHVIDYLLEENQILRSKIKANRIRFNGSERKRLAIRVKGLGRKN